MRVLLVEDAVLVRRVLARRLGSYFDVVAVESADEAFGLLCAAPGRYDAVVSDHELPGARSGVELLSEVASRWPSIRRILVSACEVSELPVVRGGVLHAFFPKPCSIEQLLFAIRGAVPCASQAMQAGDIVVRPGHG